MDAMQEAPWVVTFDPKDTLEEKLKKAAHVKPSPAQLNWMEKEFIGFVHYSPNTFNHVQWGNGTEKKPALSPRKAGCASMVPGVQPGRNENDDFHR